MDHLGAEFTLLLVLGGLVVWCGAVLVLARFCGTNTRAEERQARAERREVDGSWAEFVAEMDAKKRRADERRARWQERRSA